MKITLAILLFPLVLFSQEKRKTIAPEQKLIKYIEKATSIDDIKAAEIFKKEFPAVFLYYPNINPVYPGNKYKISSGFSKKRMHPIYGKEKSHNGIDIVAKINTPVYATANGTVRKSAFFNGAAGHSVEIVHDYGFKTKYFHLSIFVVEPGDKVRKGQIIGFLGNSGSSTAPHLHYEIWKNSKAIDPYLFLNIK